MEGVMPATNRWATTPADTGIRGLSLIECLIVLVIISLVGAGAFQHTAALQHRRALEGELHNLAAILERLHLGALTHATRAALTVTATGWSAEPGTTDRPPAPHRFPDGIGAVVPTGGTLRVELHPSGAVTPRTIHLRSAAGAGAVTISLRGRVTMSR